MTMTMPSYQDDHAFGRPLGETLTPRWLDQDVISCKQAAEAREVPLQNELKTLILQTTDGLYAVHVRGDRRLSLRAVKRFLHIKEAHLLSIAELHQLGLSPGTVCPFLRPVWDMRQLLTSAILVLEFVTTNNGTHNGYFKVSPQELLKVPWVKQGDFERNPAGG